MKRFISSICTALILATNLLSTGVLAATSYSGPDESNYFADTVIAENSTMGLTNEETNKAANTTAGDLNVGKSVNDAVYFGYDYKFDGFSWDISTASTGGSYVVEYWDGSAWSNLVSTVSADLKNDSSSGAFAVDWDERPSDWAKTTVYMDADESGIPSTSDSLYFARFRITSAYSSMVKASMAGVLSYNVRITLEDELDNELKGEIASISFSSGSGDTTLYGEREAADGVYDFALYVPSSTSYTVVTGVAGFVKESSSQTFSESTTDVSESVSHSHVLVAYNPATGSEVNISSAKAGTSNESCSISGGRAYCALTTSEDNGDATVYSTNYAPETVTLENRTSDTDSQETDTFTMNYAYVVTVTDADDGDEITDATVKAGDGADTTCTNLGGGEYGCAVPYTETDGDIKITADDYETLSTEFSSVRNDISDSQVEEEFELERGSSDKEVDFDVEDITIEDDGDLVIKVENEGDLDTDEDEDVYIYVYIEGDREWSQSYSNSSSDNFLDAGEDSSINLGDEDLLKDYDDGDKVDIEVCVDATDTVDESDEDNNCMEDTLTVGDEEDYDLEVEDLYIEDDGDLKFVLTNTGNDDIPSGKTVNIIMYVDGDKKWSDSIKQGDSDDDFLDSDDSTTFDLGDNYTEDEGNDFEVEVCVDTSDNIDEDDEDNNCMEEEESELDNGPDDNNDTCGSFTDISKHWAEEYICNLYDRDVVDGYNKYYFMPDEDVSRAEFLKMALLGADKNPYETDDDDYRDVSSSAWYYEYVTYATSKDYVEGYDDETFRPNDDISRAEALVILFRIAGKDDYDYDSSDIDFSDVGRYDWFAWAVVLADDLNIVSGYGDGTFGPGNDLSRAEAAKIIDLAYDEFYN